MTEFIYGDDLGHIKLASFYKKSSTKESTVELSKLYSHSKPVAVQQLAVASRSNQTRLAAALSDGSLFVSNITDDHELNITAEWNESRMGTNRFVGLALRDSAVFSCTSNGMVQRKTLFAEGEDPQPQNTSTSTVPSRLFDWKLSGSGETFAYGGDEVDLSIWNLERAFQQDAKPASNGGQSKRKRDELFPAEIWRAKNVSNDSLNLRQPIRITSLEYISSSSPDQHLITGTQFGDVRRYDTKAGKRPVSNWKGIGKVGGVKCVAKGISEHELFVSDNGSNLYSVDLRTGGILYGYKVGIAGAVNSLAFSSSYLASTSLDRYLRVHSVVAPPLKPAAQQNERGEVLTKVYTTSTPTSVVWNPRSLTTSEETNDQEAGEGDDDIWQKMEHID
ncbi:WD40-repeat-containing domain protein [Panaeolus papilionaceus]|nr:WD40-repeat-containing domain protein [Panaeolus papilionaceus]